MIRQAERAAKFRQNIQHKVLATDSTLSRRTSMQQGYEEQYDDDDSNEELGEYEEGLDDDYDDEEDAEEA